MFKTRDFQAIHGMIISQLVISFYSEELEMMKAGSRTKKKKKKLAPYVTSPLPPLDLSIFEMKN